MKLPAKIIMTLGGSALLVAAAMITHFEGLSLRTYVDGAGHFTVCYGHAGFDFDKSKTYTEAECEELLNKDLAAVEKQVNPLIKVDISPVTQAAIYSFVYNIGIGNFTKSTFLKKLNAGDEKGACEEMKRWVYVKGEKWKGLITRREIESLLCYGDVSLLSS